MDTKGREIEPTKLYVVVLGSQARTMRAMRSATGEVVLVDEETHHHRIDNLMEAGFDLFRYCDWIEAQGRARLQQTLMDIQERAESARTTLDRLEEETKEILFAGDNSDSSDHIMGWIRDGRGTIEQLIAMVPVSAGGAE